MNFEDIKCKFKYINIKLGHSCIWEIYDNIDNSHSGNIKWNQLSQSTQVRGSMDLTFVFYKVLSQAALEVSHVFVYFYTSVSLTV